MIVAFIAGMTASVAGFGIGSFLIPSRAYLRRNKFEQLANQSQSGVRANAHVRAFVKLNLVSEILIHDSYH